MFIAHKYLRKLFSIEQGRPKTFLVWLLEIWVIAFTVYCLIVLVVWTIVWSPNELSRHISLVVLYMIGMPHSKYSTSPRNIFRSTESTDTINWILQIFLVGGLNPSCLLFRLCNYLKNFWNILEKFCFLPLSDTQFITRVVSTLQLCANLMFWGAVRKI